jgi:hypothetical protein
VPAPGELDEEVDGRVDDRRVEHLRRGVVVRRRDTLVEVAVGVVHRRKLPRRSGVELDAIAAAAAADI